MKISFVNDWRFLFSKDAIGGRFAAFTLIHMGYMRVGIVEVDGFTILLLGLGLRIKRNR
jgi:hypothetical protein